MSHTLNAGDAGSEAALEGPGSYVSGQEVGSTSDDEEGSQPASQAWPRNSTDQSSGPGSDRSAPSRIQQPRGRPQQVRIFSSISSQNRISADLGGLSALLLSWAQTVFPLCLPL